MKLLRKLLLSGILLSLLTVPVAAQQADTTTGETPVIQDVPGLRLQIAQHTQDPYTKEIRMEVAVYSQITSDRVQVVWTVTGASKLISPTKGISALNVVPNQHYVSSAVIVPQGLGVTQVIVKVQAFQADGTYVATASKTLVTSRSADVIPTPPAYTVAQIALAIRGVAVVVLALIILAYLAYRAFLLFRKWLDREN